MADHSLDPEPPAFWPLQNDADHIGRALDLVNARFPDLQSRIAKLLEGLPPDDTSTRAGAIIKEWFGKLYRDSNARQYVRFGEALGTNLPQCGHTEQTAAWQEIEKQIVSWLDSLAPGELDRLYERDPDIRLMLQALDVLSEKSATDVAKEAIAQRIKKLRQEYEAGSPAALPETARRKSTRTRDAPKPLMTPADLEAKLAELMALPAETEWIEFKEAKTSFNFEKLGEYFSALSNEANLKRQPWGWLVFGVTDKVPRQIVGTQYKAHRPELDKLKKAIADQTSNRLTFEEIHEVARPEGRVLMFQIPPAPRGMPTTFKGHYYGREGESLGPLNIHEIDRIREQ